MVLFSFVMEIMIDPAGDKPSKDKGCLDVW
jgi:hypothetical protein